MKKIAICFPCTEEQREKLEATVREFGNKNDDVAELIFLQDMECIERKHEILQTANVIIGEPELETIWKNPNLDWVQMTWAGTDIYTTERANKVSPSGQRGFPKGVTLTNASGALGVIMAEYAIGAILALYRRFPTYWKQQQACIWQDAGSEESIYGKTVLLLGTGNIGTELAARCKAFGARTIGFRRNPSIVPAQFDEMYALDELDRWLPKADIIACSLPNKPNTRHFLHLDRLHQIKKGALLLNMGRGTLIDCDELYQVMCEERLRGVVLDVTDPEPLDAKHPLWKMEHVMITPHIAGPSIGHCADTQNRVVEICCENIKRYFTKEPLLHTIEDTDFEYER